MPITLNGTTRNLVLIDTNIIRETVIKIGEEDETNPIARRLLSCFSPDTTIFCITIYSGFEIHPYSDIYEKFKNMFSIFPFFLIFPFSTIKEEEEKARAENRDIEMRNIMYAIKSEIINEDENFSKVFDGFIKDFTKTNPECIRDQLKNTLSVWKKEKTKLSKLNDTANSMYTKYIKENPNIRASQKIFKYSYYHRIFANRKITMNDIVDVDISAIAPYVDVVITENYQAEVFRQAQNKIDEIQHLRIYTLKDLRHDEDDTIEGE